jgi:hypothetical protein
LSESEENSPDRLQDVFFYGLYMDPELIRARGGLPRFPRKAIVDGYVLRIGGLATLLRRTGGVASGIVYALTHMEIDRLYRGAGLTHHVPEALLAKTESGQVISVLCFNLLIPPGNEESNPEYSEKLTELKGRLGFGIYFVRGVQSLPFRASWVGDK